MGEHSENENKPATDAPNVLVSHNQLAEEQPHPPASTALDFNYSQSPKLKETSLNEISDKIVLVDAINHALSEEMEKNDKMVIFGEDGNLMSWMAMLRIPCCMRRCKGWRKDPVVGMLTSDQRHSVRMCR